jgi:hypothetical protein
MYRQFLSDLWQCGRLRWRQDRVESLTHEMRTLRLAGTIWERWRLFAQGVTGYDFSCERAAGSAVPTAGR